MIKDEVNQLLAHYYGLQEVRLHENKLGFQNFVYQVDSGQEKYIFRLTPKKNRRLQDLKGELEWLDFLREELVVPYPIKTLNKQAYLDINSDQMPYYFVLFNFVEGRHLDYP